MTGKQVRFRRSFGVDLSCGAAAALLAAFVSFATIPSAKAETVDPGNIAAASGAVAPDSGMAKLVEAIDNGSVTKEEFGAYPLAVAANALSYFANRNDAVSVDKMLKLGMAPDLANSFGTNALIVAIGADGLEAASALMAAGSDTAAKTDRGTPLEYADLVGSVEMKEVVSGKASDVGDLMRSAARKGDVEKLKSLVETGGDVGAADELKVTPTLEAAQAGNVNAVRFLIEHGADAKGAPGAELSPISVAVVSGNVEIVKLLLDASAPPDAKIKGVPLLTLAVISRNKEIVDLLLAAKAGKGIKGDDGLTPADVAAATGQKELARELGGQQTFSPEVDLFAAIKGKDAGGVSAALVAGVDPDQRNKEGYPAIVYAAAFGNTAIMDKLLRAGADRLATGPGGISALHAACTRPADREFMDVTQSLLSSDITAVVKLLGLKDDNGRSGAVALTFKSKSNPSDMYVRALKWFIGREQVASLANIPDGDGITPLQAAVMLDNEEVVGIFIAAGAKVEKVKGDMSLQDLARARGSWRSLGELPSDRVLPEGLEDGVTKTVKESFQAALAEWGYYKGKVDGIFGKTSRAAAIAFFKDREGEIRKSVSAAGTMGKFVHRTAEPGETKLNISFQARGDTCKWYVVDWVPSDGSVHFVGCVMGGKAWNANGIGYVVNDDGSEELLLFGDEGWKTYSQL